jgi:hypothetical protein
MYKGRKVLSGVCAALILLSCMSGCSSNVKDNINVRVDASLNGLKETGLTKPYQTAICMWAENKYFIGDRASLEKAMTDYEKWVKAKEISIPVSAFTIESVDLIDGEPNHTAIVSITIDGKTYKLRVKDNESIAWAD